MPLYMGHSSHSQCMRGWVHQYSVTEHTENRTQLGCAPGGTGRG